MRRAEVALGLVAAFTTLFMMSATLVAFSDPPPRTAAPKAQPKATKVIKAPKAPKPLAAPATTAVKKDAHDAKSKSAAKIEVKEDAPSSAKKPAPTSLPAVNPDNPFDFIGLIVSAFKTGNWLWAVALIITLLTWVFNKFFRGRIPSKFLPWIALVLASVANFFAMLAGGKPWYTAIGQGLTIGLAAAGGWSAIGKYILPAHAPAVGDKVKVSIDGKEAEGVLAGGVKELPDGAETTPTGDGADEGATQP